MTPQRAKHMKYLFLIFFSFGVIVTTSWLQNDNITALILGKSKVKEPVMRWKASGLPLEFGPAIGTDGKVYCGAENYFYCFSPEGKLIWKYYSANLFQAHPVIGKDGTVYSVSPNSVVRFSPDGKPEWTVDAPMTATYNTEPLVTNWGLIMTSQNGGLRRTAYKDFKIVVIDPKGYEREFISFGDKIKSSGLQKLDIIAEVDSFLLIRHHTHIMLVSEKGEIKWDLTIRESTNKIVVDNSKQYVAVASGDQLDVFKIGGKQLWQKIFHGDYVSDILIPDTGSIVLNINNLKLKSLALGSGNDEWELSPNAFAFKLATAFEGRMLSDGKGNTLLFNNNGHMAKINPSGKLIGQWEANDTPISESMLLSSEGIIYALDGQRSLCAFKSNPEEKSSK
jgi:hypothetical protein